MQPTTQDDIVTEYLSQYDSGSKISERLDYQGIASMHTWQETQLRDYLVQMLKSRGKITRFSWFLSDDDLAEEPEVKLVEARYPNTKSLRFQARADIADVLMMLLFDDSRIQGVVWDLEQEKLFVARGDEIENYGELISHIFVDFVAE